MPAPGAYCSTPGSTKRCSKYKGSYYCNINCQRKHWKKHKKECYKFKLAFIENRTVCIRLEYKQGDITKIGWGNGQILELLPNTLYKIKFADWTLNVHPELNYQDLIKIVKESELREPSTSIMRLDLNEELDILDLYLQGRE